MLQNVDKIQDMINALPVSNPTLSGIEEKRSQIILSQAFMKEAEKFRPWTAISFDHWFAAGRWWLLKAQTKLYAEASSRTIPTQAYADLLKASFILVDIFPDHPLRRFWVSEYFQVKLLAEEVKRELARLEKIGLQKPTAPILELADLRMWANIATDVDITPAAYVDVGSYEPGNWQAQDDIVLWRGFASFHTIDHSGSEDCLVLILSSEAHDTNPRIICQNQRNSTLLGTVSFYLHHGFFTLSRFTQTCKKNHRCSDSRKSFLFRCCLTIYFELFM